ncbi:DUF4179 domain-containing protein [Paenibacillus bovis]|uniref:DUF4179 domain-containing protein n=1 Tax=Paenibacillus bovis TaxID=1616788 RepID=A0A172ZIG5_9BACL|nr:DUF4179 domain-containing protein [Paenibacillus bovis]ANF97431.1 hypothetical protein AR543_16400 [Paenibacillus bovis]
MNNHLDQQLREKAQQIHMELPEVIRQRIDQTLSNLPDQSDRKNDNRPAKFPHKKKYSILKWAVSAVVIISLIAGVAWYKVPAFADIIRSVFTDKSGPDYGLLNARELGLVQHPDIKVQSNGYTIKVGEAIADPTRVIMALEVYGPDGKMDRDLFFNHDAILVKDETGKVVGTMYDVGVTTDFYYMIVSFAEPLQTQNITIESNITSMRQSGEQNKIYGNWKFKFAIDLTKANQQTQIVPLKGTYTSPDGMTISLKRITRMVRGSGWKSIANYQPKHYAALQGNHGKSKN